MSLLSVNLKHLYQRRSFWFLGLLCGILAFVVVMIIGKDAGKTPGIFSAPALWMLLLGTFIAALPIEVLTKPFSYCLPGHREIPRKFLFCVGLPLSFLWSLSFLFYPGLIFIEVIPLCLSAFSVFMIFYWVGVWVVLRFRNWTFIFVLFPLLILGDKSLNVSGLIVQSIVKYPLPVILAGGAVNFWVWSCLGRSNLARRYCGILWMGAFDAWNKEKITKISLARLTEMETKNPNSMRVSDRVEYFFISRISRAEAGSLPQYIWGSLYRSFGLSFSRQCHGGGKGIIVMLLSLCFICYMPGRSRDIIFFMPGLMVVLASLWVHSSLLISGGRRQRFWSGLILAVTRGVLITGVVVLCALLTQLAAKIMPSLTVSGQEFTFNALDLNLSIVPFLMVPFTLTLGLIFHKKPMLAMLFATVFFQILFVSTIVDKLTIFGWRAQVGPVAILMMLLCGWTIFIAVLRYISMRCCLVSQTK